MATQLKHTDFTYRPPSPRPNIRVAFVAGEAAIAVDAANLPDATLEELSLQTDTEALIAKAHELLSPRMYAAFLRWGEAAITANTLFDRDDDATAERTSLCSRELKRIGATDAQNTHDVMFKTYLLALEAADAPSFGPLGIDPAMASGYNLEGIVAGLSDDLTFFSPVCEMIDAWGGRAWAMSDRPSALSVQFAETMLAPFRAARLAPVPTAPTGYDPFMRGPLVQWQRAYSRYSDAADALAAFDRDVHTPAEQKWLALDKRVKAGDADPSLPAAYEAAGAELEVAQGRYDTLLGERGDTVDALLSLPAPSPSELAIKLQLFSEGYGWNVCANPKVGEQITADARRFGRHGAHIQTDEPILAAFAQIRDAMIDYRDLPAGASQADEDACFARMDDPVERLLANRATTIEGVIAKLRLGFKAIGQDAYVDDAVVDPASDRFREGLRMDGTYERILWGAVEDLARIGGVSLSEQGR